LSSETTPRRYFDVSMTSARPIAWPDCEDPPPRGSTGTPSSRAMAMAASMSEARLGRNTPIGSIW
jgi:hypothetical protein